MIDELETIEQAKKTVYGAWAGNPTGMKYREGDCAYDVWGGIGNIAGRQCNRKRGHGPGGLFCKQHAAKIAKRKAGS